MDKFCLGIIGRCLALQPWIQISDLYHRRLRMMLQEKEGIILHVSLAGRSDLEPFERMQALHKKKPLDGVLYHMRNVAEQQLFYRRTDPSGKFYYSLHPQFFKRFFIKEKPVYHDNFRDALSLRNNRDSHDLFDMPPSIPRKFFGIPRRKINLWAGKFCGLSRWAIASEYVFLERLQALCLELKIPLFVLGPTPTVEIFESEKKLRSLQKMRKGMETQLSKHQIPYYFLHALNDEMGRPIYKRDRVHLTSEGHDFLARELYPIISPWIRSILTAKRPQKV